MNKIFTLIVLVLLFACSEDNDSIMIRIENSSDQNFDQVIVTSPSNTVNYGPLKAGEVSDYQSFEVAFRYTYAEVIFGSDTLIQQPIDYVGETPLKQGNYTYDLQLLIDNQGNLSAVGLSIIE